MEAKGDTPGHLDFREGAVFNLRCVEDMHFGSTILAAVYHRHQVPIVLCITIRNKECFVGLVSVAIGSDLCGGACSRVLDQPGRVCRVVFVPASK